MLKAGRFEEVTLMVKRMQSEAKSVLKDALKLTYFMRGAVSYDEIMTMTMTEKEVVAEIVEERLEAEKKNPHPVY